MQSRKYGRTYHFPFSEGATNDDKIQKDWERILSKELVMTEKLDGENNCLKASGVYARSHAAPTRNPWARNAWEIWHRINHELKELEIFGENLYGLHSIEYTELQEYFYVFAIREGDQWLSWDDVCFFAELIDLPTVPLIKRGHFTQKEIVASIQEGMKAGSRLGGECEGYVFRNTQSFSTEDFPYNVLKYVRKNHVQTDQHWTRNWKRAKLWHEWAYDK